MFKIIPTLDDIDIENLRLDAVVFLWLLVTCEFWLKSVHFCLERVNSVLNFIDRLKVLEC